MPSKSEKQARFMRAVAHGWQPDRAKAPPQSVAREFVDADEKELRGFHNDIRRHVKRVKRHRGR